MYSVSARNRALREEPRHPPLLQQRFSPEQVVIAEVDLDGATFSVEHRAHFDDAVLDRLRSLPSVQSAGLVNPVLLNGESHIHGVGTPNGRQVLANYRSISAG